MPGEFSHYPSIPPPVPVRLTVMEDHPCAYLPGRTARMRGVFAGNGVDPATFEAFLEAGFRRSGDVIYQPVCPSCRACQSLRIDVNAFVPSHSQRRTLKRNADLTLSVGDPKLNQEKYDLYCRYLTRHQSAMNLPTIEDLGSFLYNSPVPTAEFEYRDNTGKLLAVGIVDCGPAVLSSVYFLWDPLEARRSLGIFGALTEIAFARATDRRWYHLGYWVEESKVMKYKSSIGRHELLDSDGVWRSAR